MKSIRIVISANRTRGVWSYELYGLRRPFRAAGRLPCESSNHTLLSAALTAALASIDEPTRKKKSSKSGAKLEVTVTTKDATFAAALQERMAGGKNPADGFRVAKHFVLPLYRQLVRFNVELNVTSDLKIFREMGHWAAIMLDSFAAPAFTPDVVLQLK